MNGERVFTSPMLLSSCCLALDLFFLECRSSPAGLLLRMLKSVKSVQSALSDLKRPLNVYSPSAIIDLSLLNSILMARFLKQSFAQTCLKETDNGKLQQFNYSISLITNRGTVERGKIHSARVSRTCETG